MEVFLLGSKKRIIQIETHFSSSPHILESNACPNVTSLSECNSSNYDLPDNVSSKYQQLTTNVTITKSQFGNTFEHFYYNVEGDPCSTSVKV